jgi:hypothetical protein
MAKSRPHVAKHTNQTGISSPSLPPLDHGKRWPATNVGSGSSPSSFESADRELCAAEPGS